MRQSLLWLTLTVCAAGAAYGQRIGALPPLTEQIEVHVVNVDVTVTDRHGKPVTDLTRADFELFEDGVPQNITNFYAVAGALPRIEAAPMLPLKEVPPEFRRKIALLVDNNYIGVVERNRALKAFEKQLDTLYAGDYDIAVAAVGHTLELVQPFTSDRQRVRAALHKVEQMPTHAMPREIDREILSDRTKKNLDFASDAYDYGEVVRFRSREATLRSILALQNTARGVAEFAGAYAANDGKKFMILLTGGMEVNTTFAAYEKQSDIQLRELRLERAKLVDAVVREANAANFTIHVINAKTHGMAAPQHDVENRSSGINMSSPNFFQHGGGSEPIDVSDVDSMPLSMALSTGGSYLPSTDVGESFARVEEQTGNFYSLGYRPAHSGDRSYHAITVKVKRPGVVVANRVGYVDLTSEDRLEQMLRARLTFDHPPVDLPVRMEAGKVGTHDRKLVVPFTALVPMSSLTMLPQETKYVGRVHVYLSVFDANGRNVGFHHQMQEVTVPLSDLNKAVTQIFSYKMNVHLEPGAYTVAITLRDALSNEIGSAVESLRL